MPRPSSTESRVRLNLEVTVLVRERLDRLKELTEADSSTEVIKRALIVYERLLTCEGRLIIRMPDGREVELFLV